MYLKGGPKMVNGIKQKRPRKMEGKLLTEESRTKSAFLASLHLVQRANVGNGWTGRTLH
jgi:hypothetical protein